MPLTFFQEQSAHETQKLLSQPGVLETLCNAKAGIAMALIDLSAQRAQCIRELNQLQIQVTAWVLLPHEHGYWLTIDNAHHAQARYAEIRAWALEENLQFEAVGLDIEMPHGDAVELVHMPVQTLVRLWWLARHPSELRKARGLYHELIKQIQSDGYRTETYQFPFVLDERALGTRILQRSLGFVDVRGDREVLMLYKSATPAPFGHWLVDLYGWRAQAIAIGITGGGVPSLQAAFAPRLLDLPMTLRELRRARRYAKDVYVFSLEGCVEQGMLAQVCAPPGGYRA